MRGRPNKIETITLKRHLNSTRERHNGFGYDHFIKLLSLRPRPDKANMARIFGVSRQTMFKWIKIHETDK